MRKPIIAGNWKMNNTTAESEGLAQSLKNDLRDFDWASCEVVLCPPYTSLVRVFEIIDISGMEMGAQNVSSEDSGAFTGEVSCAMLKDLGVIYIIIGHSERRQLMGETNELVNNKLKAILRNELRAIMCVGETLKNRDEGRTFEVVEKQVREGLTGVGAEDMKRVVIAYEPVWAIGTGRTATPEQAQEVHAFIRQLLAKLYDEETAQEVRIQYGGSVKPENIEDLIRQKDIDGGLIGGASLQAESFVTIIRKTASVPR